MTVESPKCNTDPVTEQIDSLQFMLGEGPGVDAHNRGLPVLEPNLDAPDMPRWPSFSGEAVVVGVRAVFGFPLRVGAVRLGALSLHSNRSGPLKNEQHTDALIMADLVAQAILMVQAELPPETVAAELRTGADFESVVSQASGIAAVQLGVSVGQALIRLRIHAFSSGQPLAEVADHVVAHHLRFDGDDRHNNWLR